MRVLQVRSLYRSGLGGEDRVAETDASLLRQAGHEVFVVTTTNSGVGSVRSGAQYVWSFDGFLVSRDAIRHFRPDVVHFHNLFHSLSPSAIWAADAAAVPSVLTSHNYRLICPRALAYRDGRICTECGGRRLTPAIRHGCAYGGSRGAVLASAVSNSVHRAIRSYHKLDALIALNPFAGRLLEQAGYERVVVRPNCLPAELDLVDPLPARSRRGIGFVGQLVAEKGIDMLLGDAMTTVFSPEFPLVIAGAGPATGAVTAASAQAGESIVYRGSLARDEVMALMQAVRWIVLPSRWLEGCPMVALEALSTGTPLLLPSLPSLTGLFGNSPAVRWFEAGSEPSLRMAIRDAARVSDGEWADASAMALNLARSRFGPEEGLRSLTRIYETAMVNRTSATQRSERSS